MNNKYFLSLKGSFFKYFSASLFSAVVGMLMNKYYTYAFSLEEYGVLSLYLTFIIYLQSYITFSMDSSWGRLYFDFKENRKAFFSTVINFSLVAILFWMVVLFVVQDYIIGILGGNVTIYWMSIGVVIITAIVKIWNLLATLENDASLVREQTVVQTLINNVVAVIFIQFNYGIVSRMVGNVCGGLVNSYFYITRLSKKKYFEYGLEFKSNIFRKLTPFYFATFFNTAIIGALSYCDRVLLNAYHGAENVGLFSIAVLIGQGISLISESCSMALYPTIINKLSENYDEGIQQLKKLDNLFLGVYIMIFVISYFLKDVFVIIFANESYLGASRVIPLMVLSYIIGALYKNVLGILSFHKIVWAVSFLGICSYLFSALLNFVIIPIDAEKGAALAFLLGTLVYSFLVHLRARKYYFKLPYIFYKHFLILLIGVLVYKIN